MQSRGRVCIPKWIGLRPYRSLQHTYMFAGCHPERLERLLPSLKRNVSQLVVERAIGHINDRHRSAPPASVCVFGSKPEFAPRSVSQVLFDLCCCFLPTPVCLFAAPGSMRGQYLYIMPSVHPSTVILPSRPPNLSLFDICATNLATAQFHTQPRESRPPWTALAGWRTSSSCPSTTLWPTPLPPTTPSPTTPTLTLEMTPLPTTALPGRPATVHPWDPRGLRRDLSTTERTPRSRSTMTISIMPTPPRSGTPSGSQGRRESRKSP